MTWQELKTYIEKQSKQDKNFLNSNVKMINIEDGEEYDDVDITELLINDNEEDEDSGWVPYLTINHSEITDGETKETSIN